MSINFSISWDKIFKAIIYLLVFLIPLFFLPWTINVLELNKQLLFLALIFLALLFFTIKAFTIDKFKISLNSLNMPIIVFLLACGLSTIFSVFSYGSFWGWPLDISVGFLSLFIFVILYFLITNSFTQEKETFNLFFFLALSAFFVSLINVFQLFGKYIFPWDFAQNIAFNTIGSFNSTAVFLAVLLPLLTAMFFSFKRFKKWLVLITILLVLSNLILINFKTAWIVLTVGIVLVFIVGINIAGSKNNKIILLPAVILAISLFFIIAGFFVPNLVNLPHEVSLTHSAELSIAKESLLKSPILGTGPGTFAYNYLMFKPGGINQTDYWNIVFEKSSSEIVNKVITLGLLGILTFVFILGTALFIGFKGLKQLIKNVGSNTELFLWIGIFSSFIAIVLAQFLYHFNFTLQMVFWLFLAGLVSFSYQYSAKSGQKKPYSRKTKKQTGLVKGSSLATGLILLLIIIFILFLSFIPKYIAETKFLKGLEFSGQDDSVLAKENIKEAIRFSPGIDLYWRELSFIYLREFDELLYNEDLSEQEIESKYQSIVLEIENSVEKAIEINPNNAENWKNKGLVYSELLNFVFGADEIALESYKQALGLDPFNPRILKNIGSIYLVKADLSQQEEETGLNLKMAKENLEKSISLKNNYIESYFLLAMVFERQGEAEKATEILESLKRLFPDDLDLLFQLGILYYNNDQLDQAKAEFVKLRDHYLDARYYLGLIYEKQGEIEKAIQEFEKINEIMPDNETIKDMLFNLREGEPALDSTETDSLDIEDGHLIFEE